MLVRQGHNQVVALALVLLVLSACSAFPSAQAVVFPGSPQPLDKARDCLLRMFNQTTPRDRKVFSQVGEDGIIESIFECIGTTNKQYVEFGVQDGRECTSRNLRENHNFTGLMMDGGYSNPALNLQQELIYASNIVQLFEKHKVPHPARGPTFDHFTVDIDVNSFGVAWKVLQAGYRPRSLAVEFNRNFAWNDPGYSVPDLPDEVWANNCYFGASARAWVNMVRSFGYHFLAADRHGVNIYFVHESAAGSQQLLTLADAQRLATKGGEFPLLHQDCSRHLWLHIPNDVDFSDASIDVNDMPVVMLSTKKQGQQRIFFPTNISGSLRQKLASSPVTRAGASSPAAHHRTSIATSVFRPGKALACEATLEAWMVVAMVLAAFVGGGLLQRIWGPVLGMSLARPSKV